MRRLRTGSRESRGWGTRGTGVADSGERGGAVAEPEAQPAVVRAVKEGRLTVHGGITTF